MGYYKSKKDPLLEIHKGLGRKPGNTKKIRTGWCPFCKEPHPLKRIPGIGYLCPTCGGAMVGNQPGITRRIYRGGICA